MDPVTAGLFVGASLLSSLFANKQQSRAEAANIKLQTEQARLQASEAALERTKSFRQTMSQNLALSGMGFGSTTALATATAQSFGALEADLGAIRRQSDFAVASGHAAKAGARANKFGRDIASVENAASLAMKLGLFV
jgi:hypothetical protein